MASTGGRFIGLVGDLCLPDIEALNAALVDICSAGPHTRVALVPSTSTRRWEYAPTPPITVRPVPTEVSDAGVGPLLEHLRRRPEPRSPLEVHVSDRHIAIDTQHGLGDGRMFVDLTTALLRLSAGQDHAWVTDRETRLVLPRALFHTFGINPRRLRKSYRDLRTARALTVGETVGPDSATAATGRHDVSGERGATFAVECAQLERQTVTAVDDWRRHHCPRTGSGVIWMHIVQRALRQAGAELNPRVRIAVDCRRYLPPGRRVNGNFAVGLEVHIGPDDTLATTTDRMQQLTGSALPLAALALYSVVSPMGPRHVHDIAAVPTVHGPVDLMYSDLGRVSILDDAPWRPDGPTALMGLLDPAGPRGVTVLSAGIKGQRSFSASFYEPNTDRSAVRAALNSIENDPIQLLTSD